MAKHHVHAPEKPVVQTPPVIDGRSTSISPEEFSALTGAKVSAENREKAQANQIKDEYEKDSTLSAKARRKKRKLMRERVREQEANLKKSEDKVFLALDADNTLNKFLKIPDFLQAEDFSRSAQALLCASVIWDKANAPDGTRPSALSYREVCLDWPFEKTVYYDTLHAMEGVGLVAVDAKSSEVYGQTYLTLGEEGRKRLDAASAKEGDRDGQAKTRKTRPRKEDHVKRRARQALAKRSRREELAASSGFTPVFHWLRDVVVMCGGGAYELVLAATCFFRSGVMARRGTKTPVSGCAKDGMHSIMVGADAMSVDLMWCESTIRKARNILLSTGLWRRMPAAYTHGGLMSAGTEDPDECVGLSYCVNLNYGTVWKAIGELRNRRAEVASGTIP
jgi:hypothetical protein